MKVRLGSAGLAVAIAALMTIMPSAKADAPQDGWTNIFDGASLKGWRGYKQPDATKTRWKVESGMLTVDPGDGSDTRGARDLITTGTYDNFELAFEWKIMPGGNSGVKYFVLEDRDSAIGHEYQVIDDSGHPDAKIGPHRQTAALYDVFPAANRPIKPAGEFNQSRIVVNGRNVEHWLNGTRVLQYRALEPGAAGGHRQEQVQGYRALRQAAERTYPRPGSRRPRVVPLDPDQGCRADGGCTVIGFNSQLPTPNSQENRSRELGARRRLKQVVTFSPHSLATRSFGSWELEVGS